MDFLAVQSKPSACWLGSNTKCVQTAVVSVFLDVQTAFLSLLLGGQPAGQDFSQEPKLSLKFVRKFLKKCLRFCLCLTSALILSRCTLGTNCVMKVIPALIACGGN